MVNLYLPHLYTGRPSSDPNVQWDPDLLRGNILYGAKGKNGWVCGGCAWYEMAHLYGRFTFKLRSFRHELLSFHALLWPRSENWPPEIDIAEMFIADRSRVDSFIHETVEGEHRKQGFNIETDATQPFTVAVEWRKDSIEFFLNGESYGKTTKEIPQEAMHMAIQVETHGSHNGLIFEDSRGVTDVAGPHDINTAIPVVEVLGLSYEPI